jgi:ketosteroid isomerase-like protein
VGEHPAREVVAAFLAANREHRFDDAAALCADNAVFEFPYGTFRDLTARATAAQDFYAWATKTHEDWHVDDSGGEAVVTTFGTLSGETKDGTPFAGIRFLDRFVLRAGRIVRQQVYNDLAWQGVVEIAPPRDPAAG